MVKIRILICALLMLLSSRGVQAYWESHWLLGISGGYAREESELNVRMTYTALPLVPPSDFSIEVRDNTWIIGALFGYATSCNNWLLGIELNIDDYHGFDNHLFRFTDLFSLLSWSGRANFDRQPSIGLTGRWGYLMAPYFLPYLRMGAQTSVEKLEIIFNADPSITNADSVLKNARWQLHWLVGVGMEVPIRCSHLSARLEYNYLFPGHNLEGSRFLLFSPYNPFFDTEINPRTHIGKISLVWNFN